MSEVIMFEEVIASDNYISIRKPVYGIGVNDALYQTTLNGVKCPYYKKWLGVMERCYSKKLKTNHPTYDNCQICDEWLVFSKFKSWMIKQDWKGKELDKDIIKPGNKVYSPENCAFIDHYTNSLMNINKKSKSNLPPGVTRASNCVGYISRARTPVHRKYLGYFQTINEASDAYIKEKHKLILKCADYQNDIRVSDGLKRHADILLKGLSATKNEQTKTYQKNKKLDWND